MYWTGIRNTVRKEVNNFDTCQCTKQLNIKYGNLTAKEAEEKTWNKLFVHIIGPYIIIIQGKKENLHLKDITTIYPVTVWFKITQCGDKIAIPIV